jgi:hypothetical protein
VGLDIAGAVGLNLMGDNIANLAHLTGAAAGYGYFASGIRLTGRRNRRQGSFSFGRLLSGLKPKRRPKPNPDVRLYEPPAEDLTREVDRLLDKINREGKESLSPEENEVLMRASESFRNRV